MSTLTPQSIRATRSIREAQNALDLANARQRTAQTRSQREEASYLATLASVQVQRLQSRSGASTPVRKGPSPEDAERQRIQAAKDRFRVATGQKRSLKQEADRETARIIRRTQFGQK